jgi:hypothetical protein
LVALGLIGCFAVAVAVAAWELGLGAALGLTVAWATAAGFVVLFALLTAAGDGAFWRAFVAAGMVVSVVVAVALITRDLGLGAAFIAMGMLGAALITILGVLGVSDGPGGGAATISGYSGAGMYGCTRGSGTSPMYPISQPNPNAHGPSAIQITNAPGRASVTLTTSLLVPPSSRTGPLSVPFADCSQWIQAATAGMCGGDGAWSRVPLGDPLG